MLFLILEKKREKRSKANWQLWEKLIIRWTNREREDKKMGALIISTAVLTQVATHLPPLMKCEALFAAAEDTGGGDFGTAVDSADSAGNDQRLCRASHPRSRRWRANWSSSCSLLLGGVVGCCCCLKCLAGWQCSRRCCSWACAER